MTTPTPAQMPNKASSQAGLATFTTPTALRTPPKVREVPPNHEHVWLPTLTIREQTGYNCYIERKVYRCLCGEEVE